MSTTKLPVVKIVCFTAVIQAHLSFSSNFLWFLLPFHLDPSFVISNFFHPQNITSHYIHHSKSTIPASNRVTFRLMAQCLHRMFGIETHCFQSYINANKMSESRDPTYLSYICYFAYITHTQLHRCVHNDFQSLCAFVSHIF